VDPRQSQLKTKDGLTLLVRTWYPAVPNGTLLAILHGIGEHGGRYEHVAQYFISMGFTVSALDQRGHGKSGGRRVYTKHYDDLISDVDLWFDDLHSQLKPSQIYLLGHSLGGLLSVKYTIEKRPAIYGLILSGPAVKINEDMNPFLQSVSGIVGRLFPRLKTVRLDASLLSRDDQVVKAYLEDPLVYHEGIPARFGYLVLQATHDVERSLSSLKCPLLVLHGSADKLVYPDASWSLISNCGSHDKTIHVFEGLYHEILNEPEKTLVLETITEWLRQRSGSSKPI